MAQKKKAKKDVLNTAVSRSVGVHEVCGGVVLLSEDWYACAKCGKKASIGMKPAWLEDGWLQK